LSEKSLTTFARLWITSFAVARVATGAEVEGTPFPYRRRRTRFRALAAKVPSRCPTRTRPADTKPLAVGGVEWTAWPRELSNPDTHRHLTVLTGEGQATYRLERLPGRSANSRRTLTLLWPSAFPIAGNPSSRSCSFFSARSQAWLSSSGCSFSSSTTPLRCLSVRFPGRLYGQHFQSRFPFWQDSRRQFEETSSSLSCRKRRA
jgi:hypothetical protein